MREMLEHVRAFASRFHMTQVRRVSVCVCAVLFRIYWHLWPYTITIHILMEPAKEMLHNIAARAHTKAYTDSHARFVFRLGSKVKIWHAHRWPPPWTPYGRTSVRAHKSQFSQELFHMWVCCCISCVRVCMFTMYCWANVWLINGSSPMYEWVCVLCVWMRTLLTWLPACGGQRAQTDFVRWKCFNMRTTSKLID